VQANPFEGGKQAVAEAWRNLSAVGADPIAITDNLNFGNPERPDTMGQIVRAIDGMAEACRALDFPVVSGNVSLYNETNGAGIPPTPAVGGVGLIPDYARRAGFGGLKAGDALVLIGETHGEMGASLYIREIFGREEGAPPPVDLEYERRAGDFVRGLIRAGEISVVHDLSDGGLVAAAAEMALASNVGITLNATSHEHAHFYLFGEDQGRYLIAAPFAQAEKIVAEAREKYITIAELGRTGGDSVMLDDKETVTLRQLRATHEGWFPRLMAGEEIPVTN
jgi:phosphoribosylformylglycinamidine synthase